MKKSTKFLLGGTLLTLGVITLSSCTSSFCSTKDKAHMMYAFDYGVTRYFDEAVADVTEPTPIEVEGHNYYVSYDFGNCVALNNIVKNAAKSNIAVPSINFFKKVDEVVLNDAIVEAKADGYDFSNLDADKLTNDLLKKYGYLKFYYSTNINYKHTAVRWENWEGIIEEVKQDTSLGVDELPGDDFVAYYKKQMNTNINSYRSCIATKDGEYGYYGVYGDRDTIYIENKTYAYAWSRGFFEGLLVWPIAALTDVIGNGLLNAGVSHAGASILAIVVITIIVRSFMLIFTAGQANNSAKMNELQPELAKIQAKYPNNTQNDKMRLAEETQKLYKKHNIHPLRSILVMFIQFPVFICVWGALQGSAMLSTGEFLGLNLSLSISQVLFTKAEWNIPAGGGALTALLLFLLMSVAQAAAMLLPQFIQKYRAKKVARLGKNPAKQQNDRRMQMFTYIMLAMIIVMGFSLASGMGIYWLIGAVFSIGQTIVTQVINDKKSKKERRR